VPYIGNADFDRPISFGSGYIYYSYGGGAFRLAPSRCGLRTSNAGQVEFQLDLIRALDDRDSHATLSCTLGAEYAGDEALSRVREISPTASLTSCVLTDWWFRVLPSAVLGAPVELTAPATLASNGLGTARIMAPLTIDTGLLLESLLKGRAPLEAVAEAQFEGVSPRLPVVVRFESTALIGDLLAGADAAGALPRQAIAAYFGRDPSTLPLRVDGTVDAGSLPRFAEAMTDRLIAQCGRYVPSQVLADAPVVQLDRGKSSSFRWALSQPFIATRRIVMPVDLLAAAQAQVERLGADSVIRRTTLTSLPSLGRERIIALCNLPVSRTGVDALGVTVTFPPHPPHRPQPVTVTGLFESADDTATLDVHLSPGEPVRYRYSPFAVLTDERGTRQIDGCEVEGNGSPLHLSTDQFPIEFAVIEVTPALGELAVVTGACTYELDGVMHEQKFTLDSGNLAAGIAVPRNRSSLTIDGYAVARDGSGQLRLGPIESPQVRLDVTSFPAYGPQAVDVRCIFDDSATLQAVSLLPMDRDESPENVTALSFTPAEPVRTFRWSSRSPFASGFRYRAFGALQAAWTEVQSRSMLVLNSSQLRKQERQRVRLETTAAGAAAPESAVDAAGISSSYDVTDLQLFDSVSDPAKKLFVPRYGVDVQAVSGQDRYRVSMSQQNATSTLEVNLVSAPAESLAEQARDARAYPHRVVVVLDFLVAASSGARKSLEFTEVTRTDNLVKASLTFATLAERDDVYRALTEQARDARLIVQRYLDVRVPDRPPAGGGVPGGGPGPRPGTVLMDFPIRPIQVALTVRMPPPPEPVVMPLVLMATTPSLVMSGVAMRQRIERTPGPTRESNALLLATRFVPSDFSVRAVGHFVATLPTPQLSFTGKEESNGMTRCTLSVTNWADFSDDYFTPSTDLPPCGLNRSSSRTWVDIIDADTNTRLYGFCALGGARQLNELWFAVGAGTPVPARVSVTLTDRRAKVERRSNAVETSTPGRSAPGTRDLRVQLDQTVSPAPFAFPPALHGYIFQGMTPTTGTNQLIRYRFAWKGTFHTYLQDASRPQVVYVFADQFKMARRPDAPYSPFATVRVSSRPDATDTDVVFDYVVARYTDPKRLDDARRQLLADPRFGAAIIEFQPFLTSDVRFFIDRPAATGSVREQRPGASVVLQGALKDTLTMSLGDFRLLFDAMHRRTASLFLGHVEIDVPNDVTESIPFSARMDDLAGEVFSYDEAALANGAIQITARNEIESPLSVQAIDATVAWNGQRKRGLVQGSALPCASLPPGSTIQFTVTPEAPPPASATPQVELDLGGVIAIPNLEAIWDSILDRTTVEYFKIVTVKAITSLFDAVVGREAERIVSILLEFEGGGTGELNAAALEAKVRVDYPIDDVMLGRPVSSTYRYTVTVIRENGRQDRDPAPREASSGTFFVSVVR
jgi:hypothetical protein